MGSGIVGLWIKDMFGSGRGGLYTLFDLMRLCPFCSFSGARLRNQENGINIICVNIVE